MKKFTKEELKAICDRHLKWLKSEDGGKEPICGMPIWSLPICGLPICGIPSRVQFAVWILAVGQYVLERTRHLLVARRREMTFG